MQEGISDTPRVFQTRVDSSGRIVLPRELRERWHLSTGDSLVVRYEAQVATLSSVDDRIDHFHKMLAKRVPSHLSLVDELIAEREGAAMRE